MRAFFPPHNTTSGLHQRFRATWFHGSILGTDKPLSKFPNKVILESVHLDSIKIKLKESMDRQVELGLNQGEIFENPIFSAS